MPHDLRIDEQDYRGPDRRHGSRRNGDRRRDDSNGGWTSLKAWANAVGIVGIPGAIAIFLVYMGATEIPRMIRIVESVHAQTLQNRDLIREQMEQTDMLVRVVQRTCSNAAKDESSRQRCFDK